MPSSRYIWILGSFLVLVAFLGVGLKRDPREVPSPLVGKPAPHFKLPQLHEAGKTFSDADMRGQVWMLNVWASWCVSCREEHPVLMDFAKTGIVPLLGLNYKDRRDDAFTWLRQFGNPYTLSAMDVEGRVGIDYGVYGVPETYLIDKLGVIRYKQIGIVTREVLQQKLIPMINELNRE
jgi:cytochrome c biogenesis protein CcmG, thiol:disulfide interchange protein DsbE